MLIDGRGKNIVIFGGDKVHQGILMTGKNVLILGEEPTDESNDTTIKIDAKYSVNNTKSRKKTCLSLHCNASNSVLYTNGVTVYQFKARDSKIKPYPLHANWVLSK